MVQSRVAVITGGGGGIGRAIALRLAASGHVVVVVGRTVTTLQSVTAQIKAVGGEGVARQTDMRNPQEIEALFEEVAARYGPLGILVTCAVESRFAGFMDLSDNDWITHFETKVLGAIRCIRHAIPPMQSQQWGRIVTVAGTSARTYAPGRMSNGMTNAATVNFSKHLSEEFAGDGILINTLHPGLTDTPRLDSMVDQISVRDEVCAGQARAKLQSSIPTGRFTKPEELAEIASFLCSESNKSITGQVLAIDGGLAGAVTY